MGTPYSQVSRGRARSLEEFSEAFRDALTLGEFDRWAADFGTTETLANPAGTLTYPLPIDAAGYKEFKGDLKYRALYERFMSFRTKEWADGVQAPYIMTTAPDFMGWGNAPANMAYEWSRLPNVMVAAMLEANPLLDLYRDQDSGTASARRLFASDHPGNVVTGEFTFDNDQDVTVGQIVDGSWLDTLMPYARSIKGANGRPLGLRMGGSTCLVPPSRERLFKKALETDTLIRAVSNAGVPDADANVVAAVATNNIDFGSLKYRVIDEFTSGTNNAIDNFDGDDIFYVILAGGSPALVPWVLVADGSPEERRFDVDSEFYRETSNVKVAMVGRANVGAALPQRIVRFHITG